MARTTIGTKGPYKGPCPGPDGLPLANPDGQFRNLVPMVWRMKTKPRPRRTSKPRVRQLDLFDAAPIVPKSTWKQPRHDKAADPGWVYAFIDPQQLGVHVEIPKWLESRKPSTEQ